MEKINRKLPFVLNTIGESPKQQPINRESGAVWNQFIWVREGQGIFNIAGNTHILGVGDGMFMRRDVPHSYTRVGNSLHTRYCTFFAPDGLIDYCIGDREYITFKIPDFLNRETDTLTFLARSNTPALELSAAGYTYVTELFSAITKNGDSVITKVKEFLENHCGEPLTLDDIAAVSGLDRFALCRYFKKHHKRSVMNELKTIRIRKAKRLLRYSSENIETIGRLCGFESPGYFALRFREECGCSPGEYRASKM